MLLYHVDQINCKEITKTMNDEIKINNTMQSETLSDQLVKKAFSVYMEREARAMALKAPHKDKVKKARRAKNKVGRASRKKNR